MKATLIVGCPVCEEELGKLTYDSAEGFIYGPSYDPMKRIVDLVEAHEEICPMYTRVYAGWTSDKNSKGDPCFIAADDKCPYIRPAYDNDFKPEVSPSDGCEEQCRIVDGSVAVRNSLDLEKRERPQIKI
jgi:hypothetical protein